MKKKKYVVFVFFGSLFLGQSLPVYAGEQQKGCHSSKGVIGEIALVIG
ncbi:MAG: hypothetical protein JXR76_22435 [Deltaproteobacteria bacterium]|nr:hypothetical protein [Deltaproteobacteria bacterium]